MDGVIVIMDYSEFDREKAKSVLSSIGGFSIVEISASDQYYELIRAVTGINLFIMDIAFPTETQGFEVLSSIKSNPQTAKAPIIITSRINNLEHRNTAALKFGVNDYIIKPYLSKRLEKSIRSLIKVENGFTYNTDSAGHITMSFTQYISKELKLANRLKHPLSILLLTSSDSLEEDRSRKPDSNSLDRDKVSLLCEKARTVLRATDTVILGRDTDILILLPGTDAPGAQIAMERLGKLLSEVLKQWNIVFEEYFHMANVIFPEDGGDFQTLMESAFRKITHRDMLRQISVIPRDTRKYADKIYNKFNGFYF